MNLKDSPEGEGFTPIVETLNYYRLEAGRFKDFVSYGLKSFAHEGVTKTRWSPSPDTIPT
jgi:hypothetical protein